MALGGTVSAENFSVTSTPYQVDHTLAAGAIWNTYELSARDGDRVTYAMTVLTAGACAALLLVQGHHVGPKSEFYISFSEARCVHNYTNSFPVESPDGRNFSVLIGTSYTGDVRYSLTINIVRPLVPSWVLGTGVVVLVGLAPLLLTVVWRRMRGPATTPLSAMTGPPTGTRLPPSPPIGPTSPPPESSDANRERESNKPGSLL